MVLVKGPGAFVRVPNSKKAGAYRDDVIIFTPDRIKRSHLIEYLTHYPVRKGESLVLIREGAVLDDDLKSDLQNMFTRAVVNPYGKDDKLTSTEKNAGSGMAKSA